MCVVADGVGGILLPGSLREGRGLPTREGTGEALTDSRASERERMARGKKERSESGCAQVTWATRMTRDE